MDNIAINTQVILDTHLHVSEYSPDSHLPLRDAAARARALGLAGLCVTDHDSMGIKSEVEFLRRELDFPIFVGIEVLTTAGDFVVFGLDHAPEHIPSARELMAWVKACNGVAVAAHPFRDNGRGARELIERLDGLSGVECFNGSTSHEDNMRALTTARCHGLACLGGSDSHIVERVGRFATRFHGLVHDEHDIIKLIRIGACEPVAWTGTSYVPAETLQ